MVLHRFTTGLASASIIPLTFVRVAACSGAERFALVGYHVQRISTQLLQSLSLDELGRSPGTNRRSRTDGDSASKSQFRFSQRHRIVRRLPARYRGLDRNRYQREGRLRARRRSVLRHLRSDLNLRLRTLTQTGRVLQGQVTVETVICRRRAIFEQEKPSPSSVKHSISRLVKLPDCLILLGI